METVLKDKNKLVDEMSRMWQDQDLTALVCPTWPSATPHNYDTDNCGLMLDYTGIWNLNGFPAGTMPVTTVRENEQSYEDNFNDHYTKVIKSMN